MKCTLLGWAAVVAAFASNGNAQNLVDLSWTPASQSVVVGDVVEIQLIASSDGVTDQPFGALDAILDWDPAVLDFLGRDDTGNGYSWFVSDFLPDPDGINGDLSDGDALYTALASPALAAMAPPSGLIVTTMRFEALAPTAATSLSFTPTMGMFGRTRVLDFFSPGVEITGDITSVATVEITSAAPFQPICFGDGMAAPCGCGNETGGGGGCANGLGVGGLLTASGDADVSNDTLVLTCSMVTAQPGLMFQGTLPVNGGAGLTFGDGIRCCGGDVIRFSVLFGQQPAPTTVSTLKTISDHPGQDVPNMPGTTFCYQYWYRTPGALGVCGSGFNLSNALNVTWN